MNYIIKGFLDVRRGVKKHPFLFVSLVLLQITLIVLVGFIGLFYQLKIFTDIQNIINPLQEANFDADSIQEGESFLQDFALVQKSYNSLKSNIIQLFSWLAGIFLIFNGFIWVLTHNILKRYNWKERANQLVKYIISALLLLIPFGIIAYYMTKDAISKGIPPDHLVSSLKVLVYFFILFTYFILIAFASININSWKLFLKNILNKSIYKIHKTIPVLAISFALLSLNVYMIYRFVEQDKFVPILITFLIFTSLTTLIRLFLISTLKHENKT